MKHIHTVAISVLLAYAAPLFGQQAQEKSPAAVTATALTKGAKTTFENVCAACHGLDGRGGERGPDIASRGEVVRKTDEALLTILRQGKPTAGMPNFSSYGDARLQELVAYLRVLQGVRQQNAITGDAAKGRALFFGQAKCSQCHMVAGQGGFLAPDLTAYASRKSDDELRSAIVAPNEDRDSRRGWVTVKLADATVLSGVPRNEDNFSLQMQTDEGKFHFLDKSKIVSLTRSTASAMPADYGKTLSSTQLNDLMSYLVTVSGATHPSKAATVEDGDDE
jgi:cytochrome c oxidase cbb3-type subunit III